MPKRKLTHQNQFHRSQIRRAQKFIRQHSHCTLTLDRIAKEAGSSSFHFARLFLAYTGETPFDFLRRVRLMEALRRLQEDGTAITRIALDVGYETSSSFNKVFKKTLQLSPREFRNLGKEGQRDTIYLLSRPRIPKEVRVNLSLKHEVIQRPLTHYVFVETHGPFAEVAPPAWMKMLPLVRGGIAQESITEYLGLSGIDKSKSGEAAMIYGAGVAVKAHPGKLPAGLSYRKIEAGNYARYLLKGPYSQIWIAFDQIFKTLAEKKVELRPEFCIENYLTNPEVTPEDEALTEILVPIG
jgi:AraC-like DNA-binding protein/DNA gyrase inhibitor GyrI